MNDTWSTIFVSWTLSSGFVYIWFDSDLIVVVSSFEAPNRFYSILYVKSNAEITETYRELLICFCNVNLIKGDSQERATRFLSAVVMTETASYNTWILLRQFSRYHKTIQKPNLENQTDAGYTKVGAMRGYSSV